MDSTLLNDATTSAATFLGVSTSPHHEPKLYYYDCFGKAEAIRMLFHHAKDIRVDLQDTKYQNLELFRIRHFPILEFSKNRISGAAAALKTLGKLYGYYPEDDQQAQTVDEIYPQKILCTFECGSTYIVGDKMTVKTKRIKFRASNNILTQ